MFYLLHIVYVIHVYELLIDMHIYYFVNSIECEKQSKFQTLVHPLSSQCQV
jgi:hypothetical protein